MRRTEYCIPILLVCCVTRFVCAKEGRRQTAHALEHRSLKEGKPIGCKHGSTLLRGLQLRSAVARLVFSKASNYHRYETNQLLAVTCTFDVEYFVSSCFPLLSLAAANICIICRWTWWYPYPRPAVSPRCTVRRTWAYLSKKVSQKTGKNGVQRTLSTAIARNDMQLL